MTCANTPLFSQVKVVVIIEAAVNNIATAVDAGEMDQAIVFEPHQIRMLSQKILCLQKDISTLHIKVRNKQGVIMINGLLSLHISRPGVCKGCKTVLDIFVVVLFTALNLNTIVKVDKFMLKLWPPLCYLLKLKFTNTPIA